MKEILFRGKDIETGEWHYGGIVHQTDYYGDAVDDYHIIDGNTTEDYDIGYNFQVTPETVSQYIGLRDCDNRRIFEGDILESLLKPIGPKHGVLVIVTDIRECKFMGMYVSQYRVIGNIWDNPELMGDYNERNFV